ncbi:acyltransferase family protein [Blastococcus sp. CCUG 61487]|uniref:acyltransferase family protein n=1 Tax=Blastococcus sp. CCUG 61487 TaxID=1840703 RepID=UPI0010BFEB4C|nr:acyltransferase family protein [Blastococcus sp. CCUG 61487]TKJ34535.1 hypothetical protein A6V29_14855 [Blastococcus sp. CCUG 61487]
MTVLDPTVRFTPTTAVRPVPPPVRAPRPAAEHATEPAGPASHFRADIQGLRAIAVGLVVLNHVTGWPGGGYVGVDVFFVISGFLITGLLLRERERSGRISFRDFYVRRARRILPAAIVVLAVTSVASQVLFLGDRANRVVEDSLWSLAFAANVGFALQGTDYSDSSTAHSPMQHFWSLSVEEQFYVAWPLLILAVTALVVGRRRRVALGGAMLAVCTASFAWSVHATAASPTTAYFSTFTRAWELGVGALVAVSAASLHRLPDAVRAVAAWAGLGGIVVAALAYSSQTPFPGAAAALPVLSAAALVAFGNAPGGPGRPWLLTSRPMRFVGDVSYSLYLWHWPVVVLLGVVISTGTWTFAATAIALSVLLAVASYLLIERPLLTAGSRRAVPAGAQPRGAVVAHRVRSAAALTVIGAVTAVACVALLPDRRPTGGALGAMPAAADASLAPLAEQIRNSLEATEWGPLHPALSDLSTARAPEWGIDLCLDVDGSNVARCRYGSPTAPRRVAVLGDSIALSWVPGLRAALPADQWAVQLLTWRECPNITAPTRGMKEPVHTSCMEHREWALDRIAEDPPDLVVMSNNYGAPLVDPVADPSAVWRAGTEEIVARVHATGARALVLAAPPTSVALEECATALNSPADCVLPVPDAYDLSASVERRAAETQGATWVDTRDWFCFEGRCPAVVGSTPVYIDHMHLTAEYSRRLAPQLLQALLGTA